ncbi:MAG: GDSL-type esterase/lipase family protein [Armatimonadota bacterium]
MPLSTVLLIAVLLLATLGAHAAEIVLPPATGNGPLTLTIKVPDIKGSYTIPYLQSSRDVRLRVPFAEGAPAQAQVKLLLGQETIGERTVTAADPVAVFTGLKPGEYAVEVGAQRYERLGVGTVIGAIGDSITEGYHSHFFWRDDLDLTAASFPPEAVSKDGRNFPQYTPTTAWHRPEVNCFQSWLTGLNDLLAAQWRRPVFIANEGVGGISTTAYLSTMKTDTGWQARMKLLAPTVWLIHLGVNDERAKAPAATVGANLEAIVDLLISEYGAKPERICLARPCYDYAEGAAPILESYIAEMDKLIERRGLRHGPDFFKAYSVDKDKWYGTDPVHPNIEGMDYMARLWAGALAGS